MGNQLRQHPDRAWLSVHVGFGFDLRTSSPNLLFAHTFPVIALRRVLSDVVLAAGPTGEPRPSTGSHQRLGKQAAARRRPHVQADIDNPPLLYCGRGTEGRQEGRAHPRAHLQAPPPQTRCAPRTQAAVAQAHSRDARRAGLATAPPDRHARRARTAPFSAQPAAAPTGRPAEPGGSTACRRRPSGRQRGARAPTR